LAQVFIYLITNVRKYCVADAPCLKIEVQEINGDAVIDFLDNGLGIPADKQDMIFEKFARADDHKAAGGAGLGLAICREVMRFSGANGKTSDFRARMERRPIFGREG
jgi:signal transduction histidine kinase